MILSLYNLPIEVTIMAFVEKCFNLFSFISRAVLLRCGANT